MNIHDFDTDNPVAKLLAGLGHGGPIICDSGRDGKAVVMTLGMTDGFEAVVAADSYFREGASRAEIVYDLTRGGAASSGLTRIGVHDTLTGEILNASHDLAKLLGVPYPDYFDMESRKVEDVFREKMAERIGERLDDRDWTEAIKKECGVYEPSYNELVAGVVNAKACGREPGEYLQGELEKCVRTVANECAQRSGGIDLYLQAVRGGRGLAEALDAALEKTMSDENSSQRLGLADLEIGEASDGLSDVCESVLGARKADGPAPQHESRAHGER